MALAIRANLNSVQSLMSAMAQAGKLHEELRGILSTSRSLSRFPNQLGARALNPNGEFSHEG
jgi:hypothetical protein